jgi:hypothetical protein
MPSAYIKINRIPFEIDNFNRDVRQFNEIVIIPHEQNIVNTINTQKQSIWKQITRNVLIIIFVLYFVYISQILYNDILLNDKLCPKFGLSSLIFGITCFLYESIFKIMEKLDRITSSKGISIYLQQIFLVKYKIDKIGLISSWIGYFVILFYYKSFLSIGPYGKQIIVLTPSMILAHDLLKC